MRSPHYNPIYILVGLMMMSCVGGKRPTQPSRIPLNNTVINSETAPEPRPDTCVYKTSQLALEIPIMLNADNEQIINYIGHTISYNSKYLLPSWVAYELTSNEVAGTIPRASKFLCDPTVQGKQANDDDYKYSGWDRGHMCPAADMKWSLQAMKESFYYTNICPQNPNLNRGDWKDLEEKCRELAQQYGEIYITCGAIVGQAVNGTIGLNKVVIPDAFYKVMLIETSNNYECIGFYFENKAGNNDLEYYARTVDEIEMITDIDFFAALDDVVEQQIESRYNSSYWSIN